MRFPIFAKEGNRSPLNNSTRTFGSGIIVDVQANERQVSNHLAHLLFHRKFCRSDSHCSTRPSQAPRWATMLTTGDYSASYEQSEGRLSSPIRTAPRCCDIRPNNFVLEPRRRARMPTRVTRNPLPEPNRCSPSSKKELHAATRLQLPSVTIGELMPTTCLCSSEDSRL